MRSWSAFVTLFVLASGSAVSGCGGDDATAPSQDPGPGVGSATQDAAAASSSSSGSPSNVASNAAEPDGGVDPKPEADAAAGPVESGQILGYVFSDSPAAAESVPGPYYSYNASGGAMKIARTGTGKYDVSFAGLAAGTVALVSAYDAPGGLCTWGDTTGEVVSVRCYSAAGSAADTKFSLTVVGKGTTGATVLGFAHANDKTKALYTPQATRSNNAVGAGLITATRSAVGTYEIAFDGLSLTDIGNVQVTPYGDPDAYCVVKSWSGATVKVNCYDNAGAALDAQYTVLLLGKKAGGSARVVAYAHASDSTNPSYGPTTSFNDKSATITALRNATGTYTTVFDGQNLNSGAHLQVSAQNQGRRCNVHAWAGTNVNLTCANASGTLMDNNYAIVIIQ